MSIKSPKNNNNIIKDISKSRLNINWNTNPSFNLYLPPLQNCRDKKNIFTKQPPLSPHQYSCEPLWTKIPVFHFSPQGAAALFLNFVENNAPNRDLN